MADKKNGNNKEELTNLVSMEEVKPAVKPKGITDEQAESIKSQAEEVVNSLVTSEGSDAMAVEDKIANIGIKDQKKVANGVELLQEKMGSVFYGEDKSGISDSITKDLGNLQGTLAKINPKDIQKESWYRIIRIVPFFGNWMVNVLKASANRSKTLEQVIEHIEESLEHGEKMLMQDNSQLTVIYRDLEDYQKVIESDAYLAEVIMEKLSEKVATIEDKNKKAVLNKTLSKVATRAQDLRAIENMHEQFHISIVMAKDNNDVLIGTTRRMLTMGKNVMAISLAIYSALQRAKKVKEVAIGTGQFIGKLMVANSTAINQMVADIGDILKNPFVPMEMLEESCNQLSQGIDKANKIVEESIESARRNVVKIKVMTEDMRNKAGNLPDSDIKSIEGSQVLQIPEKLS